MVGVGLTPPVQQPADELEPCPFEGTVAGTWISSTLIGRPTSTTSSPQGRSVRRKAKLSEPVPVRFPEDLLADVRTRGAS